MDHDYLIRDKNTLHNSCDARFALHRYLLILQSGRTCHLQNDGQQHSSNSKRYMQIRWWRDLLFLCVDSNAKPQRGWQIGALLWARHFRSVHQRIRGYNWPEIRSAKQDCAYRLFNETSNGNISTI